MAIHNPFDDSINHREYRFIDGVAIPVLDLLDSDNSHAQPRAIKRGWGFSVYFKSLVAVAAVSFAVPAFGQDAVPLHTPVVQPASVPTANAVLRAGTSVPLRTLTELTTKGKKLKVGHRFNLEVSDPVMLDGNIVIPAGSPAMGEVTRVRNKGMWGKSGAIEVRLLYVRAHDRQIRLSGSTDDKGVTGTAGVVGAAVLLPVAGFFMTGTSAVIASGSPITGFTEEDVTLSFAQAAPMVIPAATRPATAASEQ